MKPLYPVLIGLLCCLSGAAVPTPNSADLSSVELPGCDVTIRGQHGGASGTIELQLGESDVRNRVGWWTTIGGGIVTLESREQFSEVINLDFGCNARRRYRFYFEANVDGTRYQYMHYFPNENDFTQQTLIDLGDVSRFFDAIEPAPDLPSDEPLAGIDLEGEWIRSESTYDPNDGMKMEIRGQVATLTYVPQTALDNFRAGKVIWQGVSTRGEIEVLGSNDDYYPAQVTANGLNQLNVDVERGGAGHVQTWIRGERIETADACANFIQLDPSIAAIVDPIIEEEITEQELVGLAVGIVRNGQIVHLNGFGYADRENQTPVTEETIFRWASISKTVTAVAAMRMWEDGNLDLNADVSEIVPEFEEQPDRAITMWQLLSNLSGIEAYPNGWRDRAENYPDGSAYDPIAALDILSETLLSVPADSFRYSTMGFMLAGAVLDRIAQSEYGYPTGAFSSAFEQFVYEEIAEPLCMTSLQTDYPLEQSPLEPRRYGKNENNIVVPFDGDSDEIVHWRLPGGGYQSNIRDITFFANALLNQGILGADGQTRLITERLESDGDRTGYAQGLYVTYDNSMTTTLRLGHGGVQKGVRTSMNYYPTRDLAVVFLSNNSHTNRNRIRDRIVNAIASWTWGVNDYDLTKHVDCDSTDQVDSGNRFAAIWRDGPTGQILRRGYTTGLFAQERERLRTQGYHLTDLETFEHEGERLWDGVFTPGVDQTRLWRNFDLEPFLQKVTDERADDYRLVDVEVYTGSQGQHLWAGVFAQEGESHVLEAGLNTAEFHDVWENRASDGFRLVDIETYEATNGMRLWAGVFAEGSGGYGLYRNVAPEDFGARRSDLRQDGLRLTDVETYLGSQGQPLWALVGRPFDGNVGTRIDKTFCGTWAGRFTGLWETHTDQERQGRSLIDFEQYPTPAD